MDVPVVLHYRHSVTPARPGGKGGCPRRPIREEGYTLHLAKRQGPLHRELVKCCRCVDGNLYAVAAA